MDLMARRRAIMGMPSGKDYTVTGNVVSISNALAKNAKSLIVSFSPKQSGSGDPSPDNVRPITGYNDIGAVRYGRNLLDPSAAVSYSSGKGYRWHEANGFLLRGNTTYTFSVSGTTQRITLYFRRKSDGETLASHTTSVSYTPTEDILVYLQAYRGTVIEDGNVFQLEYGSTATSYEPYISPVTANVHVGGAGKNKFDVDKLVNTADITVSNGVITVTGNAKNTTKKLGELADLTVGETYILTANIIGTGRIIYLYGSGANVSWGFGTSQTITQEMLDALVMLYGGTGATSQISDMMIRLASVSDGTYEPYSLFGGTVDLVSGVCQLNGMLETFITDDGNAIMSQLNSFSKQSTGVGTIGSYTRISFAVRGDVDQTQYNRASNTYATPLCNYAKHYFAYNSESTHWYRNTVLYLFLPTSVVGSTAQSVYDWLKSIMNTEPLSMWVELATPITYTLTPSQLALLKGNNTVYSNEGSISLTYVGK